MVLNERAAGEAPNRVALWNLLVSGLPTPTVAEVGVWRGEFAEQLLRTSPAIQCYYMLDPWRHLDLWNKPYNVDDALFVDVMDQAMSRTSFAANKRRVLRGTTLEVSSQIPDCSLDLCYIDGDHTLRGIVIDLIQMYPKMKDGAILGGDDFIPSAWQHDAQFEPTLVYPFALYFAEATHSLIYALPHNQFAIVVDRASPQFEFRDLTGRYGDRSVLGAISATRPRKTGLGRRLLRYLRRLSVVRRAKNSEAREQ